MNAYNKFSYYYDDAISEIDYTLWLDFLMPYLNEDSKILDLACGSGTLAILLKLQGYDVCGLDLSSTIIDLAKEKAKVNRLNIDFHVMDMTNFKLDQKFDVITCFFDSVNFLPTKKMVKDMFDTVHKHLNKGGLFICDVFSKAMLDEYDYNEINKSFQTYDLNWITKKEASDRLVHNITIIDKLNEATLQESYHEYYYDLLKFKFANFELQKISGDFNDDYLDEDERLIFVYKSI